VFFRPQTDRVATKATLDTLLFEPEAERFCMVWRARLRLHSDIFEVSKVVVGHMSRAWWRAVETGKSYRTLQQVVRERAFEREDA
jgi:hypothetical protein